MSTVTTTARPLIQTKYASNTTTVEYTVSSSTKTLVDKFSVNNVTGSAATITIYILPTNLTTPADQYAVLKGYSLAANTAEELSIMKNQYLDSSHAVAVVAGTGSSIVIRMSGREVVTG